MIVEVIVEVTREIGVYVEVPDGFDVDLLRNHEGRYVIRGMAEQVSSTSIDLDDDISMNFCTVEDADIAEVRESEDIQVLEEEEIARIKKCEERFKQQCREAR